MPSSLKEETALLLEDYFQHRGGGAALPPSPTAATLRRAAAELERRERPFFRSCAPLARAEPREAAALLERVAAQLEAEGGLNWGRLLALVVFAGTLAAALTERGCGDGPRCLAAALAAYLAEERGEWLEAHGGWVSGDRGGGAGGGPAKTEEGGVGWWEARQRGPGWVPAGLDTATRPHPPPLLRPRRRAAARPRAGGIARETRGCSCRRWACAAPAGRGRRASAGPASLRAACGGQRGGAKGARGCPALRLAGASSAGWRGRRAAAGSCKCGNGPAGSGRGHAHTHDRFAFSSGSAASGFWRAGPTRGFSRVQAQTGGVARSSARRCTEAPVS